MMHLCGMMKIFLSWIVDCAMLSCSAMSNSLWPNGPRSLPGSSVHGVFQAFVPTELIKLEDALSIPLSHFIDGIPQR